MEKYDKEEIYQEVHVNKGYKMPQKHEIKRITNPANRKFFDGGATTEKAYRYLSILEDKEAELGIPLEVILDVMLAIKRRAVYDADDKEYRFVNKLIFHGDELMMMGYGVEYRADDEEYRWRLNELETKRFAFIKKNTQKGVGAGKTKEDPLTKK